jgi:hypothetical protein
MSPYTGKFDSVSPLRDKVYPAFPREADEVAAIAKEASSAVAE